MHSFHNYKKVDVPIGGRKYILYVADDQDKRRRGLSNVPFIAHNEGMLFVYPEPVCHAYTMEETKFPLKIIFIDKEFQVIGSFEGLPKQKEEIQPEGDFMYVIEILNR